MVWLVFSFAVSPGTWPGGAWVPGGPRPCLLFLLLLLVHDPNLFCHNFHQDVSRFTVQKGLRPNSRIMYRFFHLSSTDDERTGPGYMNQLACEQKKRVRRSCCFGDDVCKCEVAAARDVNCVDAPRVVSWCAEKMFGVLSYILDCHEFTLCPITVEVPHLRLCFRYGFATPVLGPRFPLSCALARAWCSRLSVLLLHRCCAHWVHVWQQ